MWVLTCRAWLIWKVKVLSQNSHKIVFFWCRASIWLVRRCFDVNDLLQCKHGYADFHPWTVLTCLCTFDFFLNFFWQIAHCFEEGWFGSTLLISSLLPSASWFASGPCSTSGISSTSGVFLLSADSCSRWWTAAPMIVLIYNGRIFGDEIAKPNTLDDDIAKPQHKQILVLASLRLLFCKIVYIKVTRFFGN